MTAKLTEYGMTASMSRSGNRWDKAPPREFLQQPEERAAAWHDLRNASRRAGRPVRLNRGVLQLQPPPLHTGLQPGGSVPAELDRHVRG